MLFQIQDNPTTPVNNGGNLLKQRWTVSCSVGQATIKQGRNFRISGTGNMIVLTASGRNSALDPKFFPSLQGGSVENNHTLTGANSNPTTLAIPPYWVFRKDDSGNNIPNTLIMSSSQMNKAYGRGFIQEDLIYTASLNKDFPDGLEPSFASFPSVTTPWDIRPYDEIRFQGDEDYSYVVTSVLTPAQQTVVSIYTR